MKWYVLYRIAPDFEWRLETHKGETGYTDAVASAKKKVEQLKYDDVIVFTPSLVSVVKRSMDTPI